MIARRGRRAHGARGVAGVKRLAFDLTRTLSRCVMWRAEETRRCSSASTGSASVAPPWRISTRQGRPRRPTPGPGPRPSRHPWRLVLDVRSRSWQDSWPVRGLLADSLDILVGRRRCSASPSTPWAVPARLELRPRTAGASPLQAGPLGRAFAEVGRRAVFGSARGAGRHDRRLPPRPRRNVTYLLLVQRHRHHSAHMQADYIFSANDMLANLRSSRPAPWSASTASPAPQDLVIVAASPRSSCGPPYRSCSCNNRPPSPAADSRGTRWNRYRSATSGHVARLRRVPQGGHRPRPAQAPSAAVTIACASSWMRARCSRPLKLSA